MKASSAADGIAGPTPANEPAKGRVVAAARVSAKLALHVFDMRRGGVAISVVRLAGALAAEGHRVELLLCRAAGPVLEQRPAGVKIVKLRPSLWFAAYALAAAPMGTLAMLGLYARYRVPIFRSLLYLPALVGYLRRERPRALLSAKTVSNLVALWAAKLARAPTRMVIAEHVHLSTMLQRAAWGALLPTIRRTYRRADVRAGCSRGVAEDLANLAGIASDDVVVLYNAVVHAGLSEMARAPPEHPWFAPDAPPVILGVGRLEAQKDFATLLRAFAWLRRRRRARLVILGEGRQRADLEALAGTLGIAGDVDLPGGVPNPQAYMSRAAVFALSSRWEGLPGVVIEALAAGCPVVSTACKTGPEEILDGGAYGRLVPVADSRALADALVATLDDPLPGELLRRRAQCFSVERALARHLDVLVGDVPLSGPRAPASRGSG